MALRPTIQDVAKAAGVSVATVDRVLNGRMKVREETARKVYDAARTIGYHGLELIRHRMQADLPAMTFGFLFQKRRQPFYQTFAEEARKAVESCNKVRGTAVIDFTDEPSTEAVLEKLSELSKRVDAVALVSPDHHSVTTRVSELRTQGKPVFSLLSDFAQGVRNHYIGLNNIKVGRTAAWFISRTAPRPGKVALFVGSFRWHGHELRETGFRSFFREYAPEFEVLDTYVNLDTRGVTEEAASGLLRRQPDLTGLYVAGGGMEGAIKALREWAPNPLPAVVVNELTADSSAALQDHLIVAAISTPLAKLSRQLVDMMAQAKLGGEEATPGQLFLPFDVHVPESQ
ncbi:LacI family DNA-binding transcriptional regulator [Rhizobiaceae bacterium n13]|uniref:LacI family DNA-binding transcriptional regulator n=1 Tax=Ferirhizobium litorale TaxID=2927786 RepID=A0AAE3QDY7_9HYPH|nr:LacI family DNA-binding transcriptional regulator [Fererhizobium litorale]MDI7861570.1 LacI family DNA-binding transcriptional regulator [Fererhizobium litorale]MDI7922088.1 LacI family DNA-binding transcriptional regulator [Fererhizobium litorale]